MADIRRGDTGRRVGLHLGALVVLLDFDVQRRDALAVGAAVAARLLDLQPDELHGRMCNVVDLESLSPSHGAGHRRISLGRSIKETMTSWCNAEAHLLHFMYETPACVCERQPLAGCE